MPIEQNLKLVTRETHAVPFLLGSPLNKQIKYLSANDGGTDKLIL